MLSPSRELALQTLKFAKELAKFTNLRCALLVGGDSLEDQFVQMTSNPDMYSSNRTLFFFCFCFLLKFFSVLV